jgi:arylsulfatase A
MESDSALPHPAPQYRRASPHQYPLRQNRILNSRSAVAVILFGAVQACAGPSPNVVLIIVDDLGWADTETYGSTFYDTPNIDRLAEAGVVFTDFYTAGSVCSPTRASLMTGRNPARLNITNWIGGEQRGQLLQAEYDRQLPVSEITLGDMFKAAGYTTGFVGKWHLGAEGFHPEQQGFDVNIGGHQAGQPGSYFFPYENPYFAISNVPNLDDGAPG